MFAVIAFFSLMILSDASSAEAISSTNDVDVDELPDAKEPSPHISTDATAHIVDSTTTPLSKDTLTTSRVSDLQSYIPGLIADEQPIPAQSVAFSLRGISSRNNNGNTLYPAVALYIDDMYVGTHTAQNVRLLDVDHVISRATPDVASAAPHLGGIIRLVEIQPKDKWSANLSLTAGDISSQGEADSRGTELTINAPLTRQLQTRIALASEEGGRDVVYDRHLEMDMNTVNDKQGIFKLRFHSDRMIVDYRFGHHRYAQFGIPLFNLSPQSDLLCGSSSRCSESGRGTIASTESFNDVTQNRLAFAERPDDSGGYQHQSDVHRLSFRSSIAGHRLQLSGSDTEHHNITSIDTDASDLPFFSEHTTELTSQSTLQLSLARSHERGRYELSLDRIESSRLFERTRFHVISQLNAAGLLTTNTPDHLLDTMNEREAAIDSMAILTQWQLGTAWGLTANARYSKASSDIEREEAFVDNTMTEQTVQRQNTLTSDTILGELGLQYQVDDDASLYARVVRGFRPADLDASIPANDIAFDSEHLDSFEAGITNTWLNQRLLVNLRLFQHNHRDKPERVLLVQQGQVAPALANRARVEARGSELSLQYKPVPAVHVQLNYTHLAADYLSFSEPPLLAGGTPMDLSAAVPERSPSDNIAIRAHYTLLNNHLTLAAGYRYVSSYWSDPFIDAARIESFTLWDLQARYERSRWSIDLFVRNANDKRHLNQVTRINDVDILTTLRGDSVAPPIGLLRYGTAAPGRLAGLRLSFHLMEH
ncbi:MAG: TonB-dependent receptor [Pseudomonadota bacterium]